MLTDREDAVTYRHPAHHFPHYLCAYFYLQKDTIESYKCGAEFLTSPLASKPRFALKAEPVWTSPNLLTAVAVAVENDHAIAFLGNNQGKVFKVVFPSVAFLYFSLMLK